MKFQLITLLGVVLSVVAHGDHGTDLKEEVPTDTTWEKWHMKAEHGFDDYDPEVFFSLHDMKNKGFLDSVDILNAYGLAREEVIGKGDGLGSHDDSEVIDEKTKKEIVQKILLLVDANSDDRITKEEYLAFAKKGGEFPDLNVGVGHHGDFEHEYEVHHWNKYHKDQDPEINIVHKEDIEHELLHHEHEIEHEIEHEAFVSDEEFQARIKLENIPDKFKA